MAVQDLEDAVADWESQVPRASAHFSDLDKFSEDPNTGYAKTRVMQIHRSEDVSGIQTISLVYKWSLFLLVPRQDYLRSGLLNEQDNKYVKFNLLNDSYNLPSRS